MRALSVRQPFAELIASGRKTIELRSWPTQYRGRLLICAGLLRHPTHRWQEIDGPRGMAVCIVALVDIRPVRHQDAGPACAWPRERYAWLLEDAQRIEPFPVKGRQGLFFVEF